MYDLGDQFKIKKERAIASSNNIIQGDKYRFTVLTERLIRLEYNEEGKFIDEPTQTVLYRDLETANYSKSEDSRYLTITTKYFKLTYVKNREFKGSKTSPAGNLKIELLNTDRYWYYEHPEIRNFGLFNSSLEEGGVKGKGLYSQDGMVSIDDSKSLIFNEDGTTYEAPRRIDTYVFMYNKDFELALEDFYKITGYPALIPRYALGNWWSRSNNYNDLELKELVDSFEQEEIPLSIILLDKGWHKVKNSEGINSGFTFNNEYYKNPAAMISYLHSKNIRLGLSVNPFGGFSDAEAHFEDALKYLQADTSGKIPFNVFEPKFVDVYLKLFIHPLDNMGIDFFWLDTGFVNPEELELLKHYHIHDMERDYKRRPLLLSDTNTITSHRYPAAYTGKTSVSWKTLRKIPLYNNNSFNGGTQFWAYDVGGYYKGVEDGELYIRYIEQGVFSPILKLGSMTGKYYKREPWRWDIKTYTIVKKYLKLRHELIPYLYSEAYKYHKFGKPLITPLYYKKSEYYDDVLYRTQYYFGESLFIAPIIAQKDPVMDRVVHNFYLPEGVWYDYFTGKKFPGGRSYISFFRDEDYPVFAKSGAIIPLGHNENINDTTPPVNMEINIFPGKSNSYTLFEDDGESDLYRKDFYLLTEIEYNYLPNNYSVIIRSTEGKSGIIPERRNYKIVFRNTKRTEEVSVYMNRSSLSFKTYVDGPNFIVEVLDVPTIGQLTINCKGNDIEIDAVRLINEDIERIISDLLIPTELKEKIDGILFSDKPINKKRIEVRKLSRLGLDRKFIRMFLKLLEYIKEI